MPIAVACECGHGFEVQDALEGRQVKCPRCSQPILASGDSSNNGSTPKKKRPGVKSDLMAVVCSCGKRIAAKREWAGRRVKCPRCGESVKIPRDGNAPGPAPTESPMDDFLEEMGVSKADQRCPECKSEMDEGHVICMNCGFDVERGKKLRTKTYQPSARKLDLHAGAGENRSSWLMKIFAVVVVLILLIVAAVMVPKFLQ